MSVVKINAVTVPSGTVKALVQRYAARIRAMEQDAEGFEGFEVLKPVDNRSTWLVVTRWRDEDSFKSYFSSQSAAGEAPEGVRSELWSYDIAVVSAKA